MRLVEQVLTGLAGHVLELLDLGGHRHQANVRCAVTVHAYVLIQTDVGKAAQVAQQLNGMEGVVVADGVTGPYDVIARAEAPPWTTSAAWWCGTCSRSRASRAPSPAPSSPSERSLTLRRAGRWQRTFPAPSDG